MASVVYLVHPVGITKMILDIDFLNYYEPIHMNYSYAQMIAYYSVNFILF